MVAEGGQCLLCLATGFVAVECAVEFKLLDYTPFAEQEKAMTDKQQITEAGAEHRRRMYELRLRHRPC